MDAEQAVARSPGVDRRGRVYLGGAIVAAAVAGFVAPILAYVVLVTAAVGGWVTRQHPVVRWTLTVLAGAAVAALVLGLSGSTPGSGSAGGPITRSP